MNSLEFFEKEIERYKIIIIGTKAMLKEPRNEDVINYLKNDLKEYEEKVSHLQQIKSELEAWYICKKHLEYFPSDYYNGIPEEVITMTSKIDKKDYPIIKKALEVEEE